MKLNYCNECPVASWPDIIDALTELRRPHLRIVRRNLYTPPTSYTVPPLTACTCIGATGANAAMLADEVASRYADADRHDDHRGAQCIQLDLDRLIYGPGPTSYPAAVR